MTDQSPNNQSNIQPLAEPRPLPTPTPVDMRSCLIGLEAKLNKEREMIVAALNDPVAIRDFNNFNNLVRGMQASIRSLDMLTGKTDLLGQPIQRRQTNVSPLARPSAQTPAGEPKKAKRKARGSTAATEPNILQGAS